MKWVAPCKLKVCFGFISFHKQKLFWYIVFFYVYSLVGLPPNL